MKNTSYCFLFVLVMLFSCSSGMESERDYRKKVADSLAIKDSLATEEIKNGAYLSKFFTITKTEGNGKLFTAYIVMGDTSKILQVNKYLIGLYSGRYTKTLHIWYFDKNIVNEYIAALETTPDIPESDFEKLDKHMIAQYFETNGKGDFIDNRRPKTKQ